MKTLAEHNAEMSGRQWTSNDPVPNGIACPKCGKELWDSNPLVLLPSFQPQKNVHCPACGYTGYRLA